MIIQHNMQAANANRMLGTITTSQSKSTEKLSSGYRINRAGDDAAGLAISEKMRGQIRGLTKASDNAQDGISLIQTAEGALTETHSILQRMRELAVQASNDTNTDDDRTQIQNEIDQLTQEVDRIASTTEYNTKKLLDGSKTGSVNGKDGTANVDSTFSNSNVSATITTDGSANAAFTDVIRVEITEDFKEGQSTKNTLKYTSDDLDAAITAMKNATGYAGTSTLEKNLANAVDYYTTDTTNGIEAIKTAATKSADAVAANEKLIDSIVDELVKADEAVQKDISESIFASGKTAEDVREALKDAIASYGSLGTADTDVNDAIKATLTALFSTKTTATSTATVGVPKFEATTKKDGTLNTATTVTADTSKALNKLTESMVTALDTIAKEMAATITGNETNQTDLETAEKNLEILKNTDLVTAKTEYDTAKDAYDTAKAANKKSEMDIAQAQMDVAQKKIDELTKAKSVLTVTDLFGNGSDVSAFEIGSEVDDNNELKITLKNKSGDDTVITISNADKLKAGDVITVTSQEMVESKQAATGKDALRLQVGANAGQEVSLGINSMKSKDLNIVQTKDGVEGQALDVTSQANASLAIKAYDMAIQTVSTERAKMGATQNRLEHTISNLDTSAENLQSAESRIRDVDMAEEMVTYSKNNILQQAAQSMLAQANQSTQGVLSLLQ